MRTIKLTLAYDGTRFVGWQRQAAGISVQGLLEDALAALEGTAVVVTGAGRTDAGVHALGQVASFRLAHPLPLDALVRAVNARLPDEVRALHAEEVPPDFHARFWAVAKTYRYRITTGPLQDPFEVRFAWHVPNLVATGEMADAVRALEGRHDFSAFQATGSDAVTAVRTVSHAQIRAGVPAFGRAGRTEGAVIEIELTADGFLRHMVRAIVGTLVEVGRGRRPSAAMATLLTSRDRRQAGPTAPPHGLFLVGVEYGTGARRR